MAQGVPSVVDLPPWSVTTTLLCSSPGTRRSAVLIYRYSQTSDVWYAICPKTKFSKFRISLFLHYRPVVFIPFRMFASGVFWFWMRRGMCGSGNCVSWPARSYAPGQLARLCIFVFGSLTLQL